MLVIFQVQSARIGAVAAVSAWAYKCLRCHGSAPGHEKQRSCASDTPGVAPDAVLGELTEMPALITPAGRDSA